MTTGKRLTSNLIIIMMLLVPAAYGQTAKEILHRSGVKGGLVVLADCGDYKAAQELAKAGPYIVHRLLRNSQDCIDDHNGLSNEHIYIGVWDGNSLPYRDGIVNILVANEPSINKAEIERVLAPGGVHLASKEVFTKPVPKEMDDWTHFLHSPDNNAVSRDILVGPPKGLQWWCGPINTRHHEFSSSFNAMVSAAGRVFYVQDEGSPKDIFLPAKWTLRARDGYNGVILWKRELNGWIDTMFGYKFEQPSFVARKLVAVGGEVFVPLRENGPISVLDAATGEIERTLEGTEGVYEMLLDGGTLYAVAMTAPASQVFAARRIPGGDRALLAVNPESGKILWKRTVPKVTQITLASGVDALYYHDGESVAAIKKADGLPLWKSEPVMTDKYFLGRTHPGPTLVYQDGKVFYSGGTRKMQALDAVGGKVLWTSEHLNSGHTSPEDIFVVNGHIWHAKLDAISSECGPYAVTDATTGEITQRFLSEIKDIHWFHSRCHRGKATVKYYLSSHTGIELMDMKTGEFDYNHWVRGACQYGIMPANGLIYAPPDPCACYETARLRGMVALTADNAFSDKMLGNEHRLFKGEAWEKRQGVSFESSASDWPAYRHDSQRSSSTPIEIPASPALAWKRQAGTAPTPPVAANGRVFVADQASGIVHAFDGATGADQWTFTPGGPVNSPPTWFEGFLYFGCADGQVYCLDAANGALAWRYLAAPANRHMVHDNQLESVWPVFGSVLIAKEPNSGKDAVWALAGRSMFLDGGLFLSLLDARTGERLAFHRYDDRNPLTGEDLQLTDSSIVQESTFRMPSSLNDILIENGGLYFLGTQGFTADGQRHSFDIPGVFTDATGQERRIAFRESNCLEMLLACARSDAHPRIYPTAGFLDGSGFNRNGWVFGSIAYTAGSKMFTGQILPYGHILCHDETKVFGFGRAAEDMLWRPAIRQRIFRSDKAPEVKTDEKADFKQKCGQLEKRVKTDWEIKAPIFVCAMLKTRSHLVCAGPPILLDTTEIEVNKLLNGTKLDEQTLDKLARQQAGFDGQLESQLLIFDAATGKEMHCVSAPSAPVFDGLAAANDKLYMALTDGSVVCFGQESQNPNE